MKEVLCCDHQYLLTWITALGKNQSLKHRKRRKSGKSGMAPFVFIRFTYIQKHWQTILPVNARNTVRKKVRWGCSWVRQNWHIFNLCIALTSISFEIRGKSAIVPTWALLCCGRAAVSSVVASTFHWSPMKGLPPALKDCPGRLAQDWQMFTSATLRQAKRRPWIGSALQQSQRMPWDSVGCIEKRNKLPRTLHRLYLMTSSLQIQSQELHTCLAFEAVLTVCVAAFRALTRIDIETPLGEGRCINAQAPWK